MPGRSHIRHTSLLLALGAALLQPIGTTAAAQFPRDVQAGTRVRVWLTEEFRQNEGPHRRQLLRGNVQSVTQDAMQLSIPGTTGSLLVPAASVRRIDVSQGISPVASAIERGIGGAIGGAILFGLMNDPRRTGGPSYRTDWQAAGVGAAWGAGIGAVAGLLFPHERWRRLR